MLTHDASEATLARYLATGCDGDFTYPAVGSTRSTREAPAGYLPLAWRCALGSGPDAYARAVRALEAWAMYARWIRLYPRAPKIAEGERYVAAVRVGPLWWLNACRVVYACDEREGPVQRRYFAIGTLPGHAERGEERFGVEHDLASGAVSFELASFSKPRHPLARLGEPVARALQRRFGVDALAGMQRASREK